VRLRCSGTVRCHGTLAVMHSRRVLKRRAFTLAPGRAHTYVLPRVRRRPTSVRIAMSGTPYAHIRIHPAA
jgi:hypothetical protein